MHLLYKGRRLQMCQLPIHKLMQLQAVGNPRSAWTAYTNKRGLKGG